MPKNPFTTLGVSEKVTQNELFDAYRELRYIYGKKRFEQGDAGAEASAKLEEIEAAYAGATDILRSHFDMSDRDDNLLRAEQSIEKDENAEVEEALPQNMTDRRSYKNNGKHDRSYKNSSPKGKDRNCLPLVCGAECCCECLCEGACESFSC